MGDGEFTFGMIFGALIVMLWVLVFWHAAESDCQQKHNVYDCVLTQDVFIPAPVE